MIDLNEINVFIKVVEQGSFSRAALYLELPATTVSRKVQQLEKSLGVILLRRSTRKLSLTEQGLTYFNQCKQYIAGLDEANLFIAQSQLQPYGTLRITAPLDFVINYAQQWINQFLILYPEVNIELDATDQYKDLLEDRIDICFRSGELTGNNLIARPIFSAQTIYCASPDYLTKYGTPLQPKQLTEHNCILWGKNLWQFQVNNEKWDIAVKGRYKTNSVQLAIRAAEAGLGIIKAPVVVAEPFLAEGKLQRVLSGYELPASHMYLVYNSDKYVSKTIRLFIDYIMAQKENIMLAKLDIK